MNAAYLDRGDGRIAYDDTGTGPLVVCVPGMGDVRAEYRFLAPLLQAAGYRVVTLDLRGHGDSDTSFARYDRPVAGEDVVALLTALDAGPAHLIGTSYGASAVVWAAARTPALVASAVLIGPFVRQPSGALQRLAPRVLMEALLARPWGAAAWAWWYGRLYPRHRPEDFEAYRDALRHHFSDPARLAALRAMARADCAEIDPLLDRLEVPVTVVMGSADPDFPDPAAEAGAIVDRTGGTVVMVDGAGHYPHAEQPELTARHLLSFLGSAATA